MPTSPRASDASPHSSLLRSDEPVTAQRYGTWPSPITADLIISKSVSIGDLGIGTRGLWWSEGRPEEGGRVQLVRQPANATHVDVLPDGFAARTRVHEYGGGAWWLHGDDVVFANWSDQRLYRLREDSHAPIALTPPPAIEHGDRYADIRFTADGRWVVCVRERHAPDGEPTNEIVAVRTHPVGEPAEPVVLVTGPDFLAAPRVSPDGTMLTWFSWHHPDMPWDGTELHVGTLIVEPHDGGLIDLGASVVLAGSRDESITEPDWHPDGSLLFVADRSNWWNLYRFSAQQVHGALASGTAPEPTLLTPMDSDITLGHWVFDQSRYAVLADGRILFAHIVGGVDRLSVLSADGTRVTAVDSPLTSISSLRAFGNGAALIGSSFRHEPVVVVVEVPADGAGAADGTGGVDATADATVDATVDATIGIVRPSRDLGVEQTWFAHPESIEFATTGDRTAHGLFYPPTNPTAFAPAEERPPLIVLSHGGPTAAARPQLSLGVQFWTSRGFAVVDVNYGGSTGYGRAFRKQLDGLWGIVDVEDCIAAAQYLAAQGRVDAERLIIRGGSAGGFTTLAALTFHDVFAAGCSLYGIADLEVLATDTHKFESRYLDSLIGPWPERSDLYRERSPIHHTEGLSCPLIVLQGLDDAVVPPNQAELMVQALAERGLPHAYLVFEGEGHGFRQAATMKRALEAEAYFYSRILGFELADPVEPVTIVNL